MTNNEMVLATIIIRSLNYTEKTITKICNIFSPEIDVPEMPELDELINRTARAITDLYDNRKWMDRDFQEKLTEQNTIDTEFQREEFIQFYQCEYGEVTNDTTIRFLSFLKWTFACPEKCYKLMLKYPGNLSLYKHWLSDIVKVRRVNRKP